MELSKYVWRLRISMDKCKKLPKWSIKDSSSITNGRNQSIKNSPLSILRVAPKISKIIRKLGG
tara:strand:+ start:79 stop:267 length:189 start_codon:yes stop_codon:yes gene_type:complete